MKLQRANQEAVDLGLECEPGSMIGFTSDDVETADDPVAVLTLTRAAWEEMGSPEEVELS